MGLGYPVTRQRIGRLARWRIFVCVRVGVCIACVCVYMFVYVCVCVCVMHVGAEIYDRVCVLCVFVCVCV